MQPQAQEVPLLVLFPFVSLCLSEAQGPPRLSLVQLTLPVPVPSQRPSGALDGSLPSNHYWDSGYTHGALPPPQGLKAHLLLSAGDPHLVRHTFPLPFKRPSLPLRTPPCGCPGHTSFTRTQRKPQVTASPLKPQSLSHCSHQVCLLPSTGSTTQGSPHQNPPPHCPHSQPAGTSSPWASKPPLTWGPVNRLLSTCTPWRSS